MENFSQKSFSKNFLQKLSLLLLVLFLGGCEVAPAPFLKYLLGDKTGVKVYTDIPTMYFAVNSEATLLTLYTTTSTNTLVYTEGDYKWGTYEGANIKLQLFDVTASGGTFKLWENGTLIDEDAFIWWIGDIDLDHVPIYIVDKTFIISDMLYLFSDDGTTLIKRTYNISDKTHTDTVYSTTSHTDNSVTYKLDNEEINITDITDTGGKIDGEAFKYFSLGEVTDAIERAAGYNTSLFYGDSIRLDSEGVAYFLSDDTPSFVSFDNSFYDTVKTIFDSTGSDTESYIANYVTNIVENYVFDSQNDVRISIDKTRFPDATTITKENALIEGDSKGSVSVESCGRIKITGNISGTLYIEGDIVSSSHGIYIYVPSSSIKIGDIIVNGSVSSSSSGIYIFSASSASIKIGDIIVNGSVSSSSSGIYISSSSFIEIGDIIVNGSVSSSSGGGSGIAISSSSFIEIGDIIVNGGVSGSDGIYIYSSSVGDIIVNGSIVSGSDGICIYSSSSSSVGDIIVNGSIVSGGDGIYIYSSSSVGDIILSGGITGGTNAPDNIPIYDGVKNIYTYIYYTPDKKDKYDFMVYF